MNILLLALIIMAIAVLMVMTGHGGGNFFIIALVLAGIEMHVAATTVQFVLFTAAFLAMLVFGRKKYVEWKLALFMGVLIGISAFSGGFLSDYIPGNTLKLILSALLFILAILMLKPVKETADQDLRTGWKYWHVQSFDHAMTYSVNLIIVVPTVLAFGFIAGMVGISGGSFMVPLLVLACGVPMKNAVATASTLVAVSALTGFSGHAISGHFDYCVALPLAMGGAVGGLIGGSIAIKSKPQLLKILFAVTTLVAAVVMAYEVFN
ncbi:MAG: sulfite exporter TauE/SafE family protein [Deltaproteobacteria bacterium]|nr:sulfite exporter TauE/SafE family protein [Deltaproteobacteria bacterium]MBN2686767.1 sulfite exporter TauE/SafE family protein [Deltaproteobacteria bacterium]